MILEPLLFMENGINFSGGYSYYIYKDCRQKKKRSDVTCFGLFKCWRFAHQITPLARRLLFDDEPWRERAKLEMDDQGYGIVLAVIGIGLQVPGNCCWVLTLAICKSASKYARC